MAQMDIAQIFQLISWITALIEIIIGLYILLLNIKNNANRHVSILLILFAINTFAQGQLFTASRLFQIEVPILLLAATTPAIQPGLLLIAFLLLKPQWLQERMVLLKWFLYGLIAFPIVLTILDNFSQTNLWFTGLQLENYTGGFVNLQLFTQGILGPSIRITFIYTITVVTIFPLAYIAIFDKSITQLTRRLAFVLLGTQVLAVSLNFVLFFVLQSFYGVLITSTIFAIGYTYAVFWQLISERRLQSGKLQIRLTALILAVTIPVLISLSAYIITRAGELVQLNSIQAVEKTSISFIGFQTVVWIFIGVGILLLGALTTLTIRQAVQPIVTLTETAMAITKGDLSRVAPVESDDEIGILAQSFNRMTEQLLELIGGLETRVSERTVDLEKRSSQLQAAADVARTASSVLDINQLIQEVVGVIQERFDLYYVGLFLLDETKEWAYLRAGTGEAGREMLARGHRIQVGQGMVGWTIANAQPRIASEADKDTIRLETTELSETRSEAAIPLRLHGEVIGAITVQDIQPDTFDRPSIASLQTMADLVSIAIENARLFTESQEALEASRRAYGDLSSGAWKEISQKEIIFHSNETGTFKYQPGLIPQTHGLQTKLTLPIMVRDSVIGELTTRKPENAGEWLPDEIGILEAVVEQLGVALESARLYEETQRRVAYEQLTREVTDQMRESLDIDTVLRIAAAEFKRALDLSEVEIRLGQGTGDIK
jgi:nitrate/nitrite-specific signal transduction histidine kinase